MSLYMTLIHLATLYYCLEITFDLFRKRTPVHYIREVPFQFEYVLLQHSS